MKAATQFVSSSRHHLHPVTHSRRDSCRPLCSSTYLVVLFVRQRAFPTSNADPQTTSLARHFDL